MRLRRERAAAASGSDEGDGEVMADVREAHAWEEKWAATSVRRANERESAEISWTNGTVASI